MIFLVVVLVEALMVDFPLWLDRSGNEEANGGAPFSIRYSKVGDPRMVDCGRTWGCVD